MDFVRDVNELRYTDPNSLQKQNILSLMTKTFERRRTYMEHKTASTTHEIIVKFPRFLSYNGDVLEQEFSLMFPGKGSNFPRIYTTEFVPKILKIAQDNPEKYSACLPFADDTLNATVVLSKLLPTPKRVFAHEAEMPLHPKLSDFFRIIPLGCDPKEEATKYRMESGYPVQPHLMAIGNPKAIGAMFLVIGDSDVLGLHRSATPTKAVDLLFKTYHALNIHYPLGWKNVFRFLQVHIYHIPLENKRESSFLDQLRMIKSTSL